MDDSHSASLCTTAFCTADVRFVVPGSAMPARKLLMRGTEVPKEARPALFVERWCELFWMPAPSGVVVTIVAWSGRRLGT